MRADADQLNFQRGHSADAMHPINSVGGGHIMKKLLLAGLLGGLLVAWLMPAPAIAQDAFDGTWKVDLNKAHMPKKPDVLLLQNGIYECKTCTPAVSIKADGEDHKVTGHPYFDTMAVKATDDTPSRRPTSATARSSQRQP
jgi:hypothetical protein